MKHSCRSVLLIQYLGSLQTFGFYPLLLTLKIHIHPTRWEPLSWHTFLLWYSIKMNWFPKYTVSWERKTIWKTVHLWTDNITGSREWIHKFLKKFPRNYLQKIGTGWRKWEGGVNILERNGSQIGIKVLLTRHLDCRGRGILECY